MGRVKARRLFHTLGGSSHMAHEQLRTARTDRDVLVSNLRAEVGGAITTWVMLRHFIAQAALLRSPDPSENIGNRDLAFLDILIHKLEDELIAKLAELGDEKIGRTNFYFASQKLKTLSDESKRFSKFVVSKKFRQKRNQEIAHREQPEQWFEDRPIHIPYITLLRSLGMAVRLMKKFDRIHLGPASPYLWNEARKKRADLIAPARSMYLLLPHYRLSPEARIAVALQEQAEGKVIWSEMKTVVNGTERSVLANKEWGLLYLPPSQCLALPHYPLQRLDSIDFNQPPHEQADA